ncbi:MAG: enoyl-CoA hydratase/isomerase family protein [Chloroflexi bacterium]|nr:enoyl-CoA hydratase/isomerase family protein [Chloroflexota bacterium]
MAYETLTYEKKEGIGIVTLNRPKARNAFSFKMRQDVGEVFTAMEEDPEVLVAILTGNQESGAFSAGADIADPRTHAVESVGEHLLSITPKGMEYLNAIVNFSKPLVAAINGYALGIGFQVCLCCDILIASENAEMGYPEASLGLIPIYGGSLRLARFVGKGNAMRMLLTGQRINSREALRIGLVSEVVPLSELMPAAEKIARRIASLPPISVRLAKQSLNSGLDASTLREAAQADLYRLLAIELTEDTKEAHVAWRERRPPVFKGR